MNTESISRGKLDWDTRPRSHQLYEEFWKDKRTKPFPAEIFQNSKEVWIELGAGTGDYFFNLAPQFTDVHFLPFERCRTRAKTLIKRSERYQLKNLTPVRGNVIPALIHGIPQESVDRIFILYPCPWPKNSQRKHRWYLHPVMPHLIRILKPGGKIIWASDQEFYISECHYVLRDKYKLDVLSYGTLTANPYNLLEQFPKGRTKFESDFLSKGQNCFELIVQKPGQN